MSYETRIRSKEGLRISLRIVVAMAATCLSVDIPDPRHQQALKYSRKSKTGSINLLFGLFQLNLETRCCP